MVLNRLLTSILCLTLFTGLQAQKGKDLAKTVSAANSKVNEFTALTSSVAANATILNVTANGLNTNARFTSTLTPGDLVMIIQMQGAKMNLGTYAVPWQPDSTYGKIYDYSSCGNYEFAEVKSTISNNQIELTCGLTHSYSSTGKTQIVRVPRFSSLNVTAAGVLTTDAWNGSIGGVLAIEVDGNTTIDGTVNATGLGFRGGVAVGNGGNGNTNFVTKNPSDGAEKGEGIGGDRLLKAASTTTATPDSLGYQCKGAPANGGGGGNANNCAGGGGGNGGNINNYKGLGITNLTYSVNFELEYPGRSSITSSGGGKGGYGTSTTTTANPAVVGPNSTQWGAFKRPSYGGFGGRPLDYSTGKIFMGGGGGAGHMSSTQSQGANACSGGAGGGLIYFLNYGSFSGTGNVTTNGANGNNAFGTANFLYKIQGIDGAGGAGAGGTIIFNSNGPISSITANANGGNGGNQVITTSGTVNVEGQGPGGGGSGGYIAATGIGFTQNVNGGVNGITNSSVFDTEFPMNGATSGDLGTKNQIIAPSYSLTASSNPTICTNQSATLTATSTNTATTIQWYNSLSTAAISTGTAYVTPTYTATGNYTVYAGSCPGIYRLPIIITVTNGPTFSINSPTICSGQSTVLTVTTSATTYTWNTAGSPTTNTLAVSPSSTTIYTINGSSSSCVGSQTTQVTVNNAPTVSVPNATICTGTSTILTASGTATSFTWMPGNITTSTISANSNTAFTITGSNGTCTNSTTASVSVNPTPTLTANSATICSGQVATFTVSGASTYTWNPGSFTGTTYTTSPASSTTVSVIGANGSCTAQITRSVTVSPNPTITVTNQTICPTQTITLTAGGATTYTWNTGQNTNTISVSPSSLTVYTVSGTTGLCSDSKTVSVTVVASPTIAVAGSTLCSGNSTTLTASGASAYTWSPGGQVTTSIVVSPTLTTTYSITGTNGTCTNSTTVTVSVISTPTLTANSATICAGQVATFTVNGASTYTWNPGSFTGITYTTSPASSSTVSVIGANGTCTAQITRSVTVSPNPTVTVTNQTICPTQTITLTANGATTYSWNTGQNTNTISVSPSSFTIYSVTGTTGLCSDTKTVSVTVSASPTITVANATICSGNSTTLTASGASNYTWSPGGQLTSSISVSPSSTQNYTITGSNGTCTNSTIATISVTSTPTLVANSVTICPGQTATLTASGATNYTWNPGSLTGTTYTISPASDATVSLTGANGNCFSSITLSVTIGTGISIGVNNPTICAGQTASLTASGATSYTWDTGANTNTLSVNPTSTQIYTVSGTSGSCSGVNTATVTVVNQPTVSVSNASVCSGNSTTLTASGASTYTWMPGGQTTTSVSVNPTSTEIYTITGSNGICTNSTTATVNVTNTPTLTVNSVTICPGQTATLTVSGANTYTWNPGNISGNTFTLSPLSDATVTVTGENNTCTSSTTATITIGSGISISVNSATICAGQTASLIASGASTYTWDNGATTNTLNVNPATTTIYTVTGSNGSCNGVNTATVTVVNSPTVTATSASICSGNSATLTASGAISYTWMPGGQTTASISDSPGTTTIYTVTGSDGTCSNTATASINVTSTPTLVANSVTTCAGQNATLTVSGATSYTWDSGSVTGNTYTISPLTNTLVTVIGANGTCTAQASPSITIGSGISISVNNPTICAGETASLTAGGATSYTWDSGANTNTLNVSPISTTIYTVTGSNGSCNGFNTATVTVNSVPTITVNSPTICAGNSFTLTAAGAMNYTWLPGGQTTVSITDNPGSTTIYTITGTNGNCTGSITSTVTVNSIPTLTVNPANICAGQTATLIATGASTYTWSTTETTPTINPTPINTSTYSVMGSNGNCNSAPLTVTITVSPSPTLSVNALNTTGCSPVCVNFTDVTSSSCSTILYNFGDGSTGNTNNPTHCYASGGTYTVTATCTNTLGCVSTFTVPGVIQVDVSPNADFFIGEGNVVTAGSTVNLTNSSSNATSYIWSLCGSVSTLTNVTTSYADTGNCCIELVALNTIGCSDTVIKCIQIVDQAVVVIPNVFTPNGDASNEFFKIKSIGIKNLNCVIFDRWGLKMHEWDGINGYWDGNAKSGEAPAGTYFYIINYTDQLDQTTTEKGFLNLFRD